MNSFVTRYDITLSTDFPSVGLLRAAEDFQAWLEAQADILAEQGITMTFSTGIPDDEDDADEDGED